MRTKLSGDQSSCITTQGKHTRSWQQHDVSNKNPSRFGWVVLILTTLLLLAPATALSKGPGGGGGGGGGGASTTGVLVDYGDVFGDLIHVLRDDVTGQPIFAQRWVEMPAELPGYGWGYCAIGIDEDGFEIPFQPYSCDLDTSVYASVEVDYFGRLNAGRVQERNMRMHFNETISNIKQAGQIRLDPTGRLELGFESELNTSDPFVPLCFVGGPEGQCVWSTIDSPMENLALYRRMMKYGHIVTNPNELDLWWHGDPKLPTPYHPALDANDFLKFDKPGLFNMLSGGGYNPEHLTLEDFNTSAVFLGAASGKHGIITEHLVQYLNRFLRITQTTEFAASTLDTLPALYLDCWPAGDPDPWKQGEEAPEGVNLNEDLVYGTCDLPKEVDDSIPNYDDFTNVQERFMDFDASGYIRNSVWSGKTASLALESSPGTTSGLWAIYNNASLLNWIVIPNPALPAAIDIHNFVGSASDALRAIEYTHNYEVPENLYCFYDATYCQ
jgi:hypothetical protein